MFLKGLKRLVTRTHDLLFRRQLRKPLRHGTTGQVMLRFVADTTFSELFADEILMKFSER
jgi:hypothetical protein